jgi:hypothetical protein
MAEFEERPFGDFAVEQIEQLKEQATRSINDFAISFVLGNETCGSGTLVDAFGSLGILTAFHVADEFDRHKDRSLFLMISRQHHRFELPRTCFEHVPLGRPNDEHKKRAPDISFLKISGIPQLSTIKSKKSFYRVPKNPLGDFTDLPFNGLFWWIAGTPASSARRGGPSGLQVVHLVAQADYEDLEVENEFDVPTLNINASTSPLPGDYSGCSGGGVWLCSLAKNPSIGDKSLGITWPVLVGVAYYQGDLIDGRRDILANGPKSLAKLKALQEAPT